MTKEQLRIAVAEKIGWKRSRCEECRIITWSKNGICQGRDGTIPPYSTSIDAIQAACLEWKGIQPWKFTIQLRKRFYSSEHDEVWQLTAYDWCHAFLATCEEIENLAVKQP